jgi:hypothetical protein
MEECDEIKKMIGELVCANKKGCYMSILLMAERCRTNVHGPNIFDG